MIKIKRNFQIINFFKLNKPNLYTRRPKISMNLHINRKITYNFCTKNNTDNFKRYDNDYEAPENNEFDIKTIIERVSIFLIKVFSTSIMIYFIFFKKFNELTKEREIYFINESWENWLSNKVSKRLQTKFYNEIYREDSEENERVNKIYNELLEKNKIKVINTKVFVLKLPNIGCFLLKNGDLLISSSLLDLAKNDEEIAFMIAHEISIIIQGKFMMRLMKSYINYIFFNSNLGSFFKDGGYSSNKVDYVENKYSEFIKLNFFLNFYPENPNFSFFEHIAMFNVTIKLLKNTDYSLTKSIEIIKELEKKFVNYNLRSLSGAKYKEFRYYNSLCELISNQ